MREISVTLVLAALLWAAPTIRAADKPATEPDEASPLTGDLAALVEHKVIDAPAYWQANAIPGGHCDGEKVAALLMRMASAFKPVSTLSEAMEQLVQHGITGAPTYWNKHAVPGGTCDGDKVAILLGRMVGRLPTPVPKAANAAPLEAASTDRIKLAYDVVIAGAGTGGCGAAIQAARMGCSVLLLEETDWIGGQMNAAAVTSMDEGVTLVRERGIYRELCGMIAAHYSPLGIDYDTAYWHSHVCVEPRVGRVILLKMLADARGAGTLDLLLRSHVTKVAKSGDTVTGAEFETDTDKGVETHAVASKILIDATEWGDVIPLTGARYRTGNCINDAIDPTRHIQDLTWTAVVKQYPDGVPAELQVTAPPPGYASYAKRFSQTLQLGDSTDPATTKPTGPWNWAHFIGYRGMPDSSRPPQGKTITRTHLNYNNDYPATVADIEQPAAREATLRAAIVKTLCLLHYIQVTLGKSDWAVANDEGYDTPYNTARVDALIAAQPDLKPYRAVLVQFPVMAYARESRRIIGLHTLTAREIERRPGQPVQFRTTVALGDYAVDLHGSMTPKYLELDLDREEDIPHKFGERGLGPFAIPFECFIPEKVDGFLPAEKNFSQSRMGNGATRLQPHTLLMGQAVGVIAALAIRGGIQPRAVDPEAVQRVLLDVGCTLAIRPVSSRWGGPEWKEEQLKVLREGAIPATQE